MAHLAPVSVRVSAEERVLLESAARTTRTTLSDFIRRKAIEAAEIEMMENRVVTIPAEDWERFEEWARSPPQDSPELRRLAAFKPVWQD